MPITFYPDYGTILYCCFDHQSEPEMVKTRPVVVLSRRKKNNGICTVVPFSGTEPDPYQPWHHKLDGKKLPQFMRAKGVNWWAKCDCITTVKFDRLDRPRAGRDPNTGKRLYASVKLNAVDLLAVKMAVIQHLGFSDLIPPRT